MWDVRTEDTHTHQNGSYSFLFYSFTLGLEGKEKTATILLTQDFQHWHSSFKIGVQMILCWNYCALQEVWRSPLMASTYYMSAAFPLHTGHPEMSPGVGAITLVLRLRITALTDELKYLWIFFTASLEYCDAFLRCEE